MSGTGYIRVTAPPAAGLDLVEERLLGLDLVTTTKMSDSMSDNNQHE